MKELKSKQEFKEEIDKLIKENYLKELYKSYKIAGGFISYKEWMEITVLNSPFYLVTYKN